MSFFIFCTAAQAQGCGTGEGERRRGPDSIAMEYCHIGRKCVCVCKDVCTDMCKDVCMDVCIWMREVCSVVCTV